MDKAPQRAFELGCECFQIFSRSPHGGKSRKVDEKIVATFKRNLKDYPSGDVFIHSPYYINFASGNNRIRHSSTAAVRDEMRVADLLGVKGVVTHLGSAKDLGIEAAKEKLTRGICRIFEIIPSSEDSKVEYRKYETQLLVEITAGAGNIMGDTFEEIAEIIEMAEKEIGKNVLGVCFDTAHAFASGYDLRDRKAVKKTFRDFDKVIGIERIKLVHLNDSMADFNSHTDRHANIGEGKIGMDGIGAILAELESLNLNFILETPLSQTGKDLEILKKLRKGM